MMSMNKEERREIYSAMRKINGYINKMREEAEWISEKIGKANDGVFQTKCMIDALKAIMCVMQMKLNEEMHRPGYKTIRKELGDEQ